MLASLSHLVNTDKSYTEYDLVGSTSLNHGVFLLVKSNIPLICRNLLLGQMYVCWTENILSCPRVSNTLITFNRHITC